MLPDRPPGARVERSLHCRRWALMVQVLWCLGFRVWGLGLRVWGLGFGVWGLGFRVQVWGLGFRGCVQAFRVTPGAAPSIPWPSVRVPNDPKCPTYSKRPM